MASSLLGHELLHLAKAHGLGDAVKEALLSAHCSARRWTRSGGSHIPLVMLDADADADTGAEAGDAACGPDGCAI